MKNSFIMYTEYMDALCDLTDAQAGQFLIACMEYTMNDDVPEIKDPAVRIAFKMAKPRMDKDAQKWQETVEKRKQAGRLGGQAKASKGKHDLAKVSDANQTQANASKGKQSKANLAVSDCVIDCVNDNNKTLSALSNAQIEQIFQNVWAAYPEKKGKSRVSASDKKRIAEIGEDQMMQAINLYKRDMQQTPWKHYQHGSTFFHGGYLDYLPENYEPTKARARPAAKFNNAPARECNMIDLEKKILASN